VLVTYTQNHLITQGNNEIVGFYNLDWYVESIEEADLDLKPSEMTFQLKSQQGH
jgi:hypothetical protein